MKRKRLSRKELRQQVEAIIEECNKIAIDYIEKWKPVHSDWETIEGSAYLRLSTDDQVAVEKGSLEQQIYIAIVEALERSKSNRTNYKIVQFYIEPGITGRHDRRPQFIKLQNAISKGKHQFVIFKEIARISREMEVWKRFFKLCNEKECEVCIKGFPINPNDPSQTFLLDILAAVAEYESNLTSKRIKETVFSAMITSGKFNSTRSFLGLDSLMINGEQKTGLYVENKKELKQVEWIMGEFIRVPEYKSLLDRCKNKGITNKNGLPFTHHTLKALLTNQRYIGKWEVHAENKDKKQDKLMPYDRYTVIDLPHGCLIDKNTWEETQKAVSKAFSNRGGKRIVNRAYPLSKLLFHKDGTPFGGESSLRATISGKKTRHLYYRNKRHCVRIKAPILEGLTESILNQVVNGSKEFQEALTIQQREKHQSLENLNIQIRNMQDKMESLKTEQENLDRRLDFLLNEGDTEEAKKFRKIYKEKLESIEDKIKTCRVRCDALIIQREEVKAHKPNVESVSQFAKKALGEIENKEDKAVKTIYQDLFQCIVVGDEDEDGVRPLSFILKGDDPDPEERKKPVPPPLERWSSGVGTSSKLVTRLGLEPRTLSLKGICSTN